MTPAKSGKKKPRPPVGEVSTPESGPQKRVVAGVCVVLAIVCIAVYGQMLSHSFLTYDDTMCVTENLAVQAGLSWANLAWAFTNNIGTYMLPITWMSHMIDCDLYGLRPWGHHLTNLIFHIVNSILLFLVFAKMTRRVWPSALVAVLFAAHPLHVETVAWVAERKGLLGMLFWAATLGGYAWYRQRPNPARYLTMALLFLFGLMSKPTVLPLPFVLLLLDYWPLGQIDRTQPLGVMARRTAWLALEKVPLLLLTALFSVVTFMLTATRSGNLQIGEKIPFLVRCANAVAVYALFAVKTVWPSGLAVFYPYPPARPLWQVGGAAVMLAAITVVCLLHARRRPYLIVGWLWYLGALAPVIGVVQAGEFSRADRYTYIPLTGLFIMFAWGAADLAAAWQVPRRALAVAAAVALAVLGVCAGIQTSYWYDSETLFRHAISVGQESSVAFGSRGNVALEQGRYGEAKTYLMRGLELNPNDTRVLTSLGKLAMNQKRYDEARTYYTKAINVNPGYFTALNNLGLLNLDQGKYDEAGACLTKALNLKPDDVSVLNNLGKLAVVQKRYNEAKALLTKALKLDPSCVSALNNLGGCLAFQGKHEEALRYFRKAVEIDPQFIDAINNLGATLARLGHEEEANRYIEKAAELKRSRSGGRE